MRIALFSLLFLAALPSSAAAPARDSESMCQQWADEEGLSGEERESYLRRCREESEIDSLPAMDPMYQDQFGPSLLGPDSAEPTAEDEPEASR